MVDTTIINFAIGKLSQAWQSMAPQVKNVSEEYVKFVLVKQFTETAILFGIFILTGLAIIPYVKYARGPNWKSGDAWHNSNEIPFLISTIILVLTFGMGIPFFIMSLYNSILAFYCPYMFVINQLFTLQ